MKKIRKPYIVITASGIAWLIGLLTFFHFKNFQMGLTFQLIAIIIPLSSALKLKKQKAKKNKKT